MKDNKNIVNVIIKNTNNAPKPRRRRPKQNNNNNDVYADQTRTPFNNNGSFNASNAFTNTTNLNSEQSRLTNKLLEKQLENGGVGDSPQIKALQDSFNQFKIRNGQETNYHKMLTLSNYNDIRRLSASPYVTQPDEVDVPSTGGSNEFTNGGDDNTDGKDEEDIDIYGTYKGDSSFSMAAGGGSGATPTKTTSTLDWIRQNFSPDMNVLDSVETMRQEQEPDEEKMPELGPIPAEEPAAAEQEDATFDEAVENVIEAKKTKEEKLKERRKKLRSIYNKSHKTFNETSLKALSLTELGNEIRRFDKKWYDENIAVKK